MGDFIRLGQDQWFPTWFMGSWGILRCPQMPSEVLRKPFAKKNRLQFPRMCDKHYIRSRGYLELVGYMTNRSMFIRSFR